MTVKPADSYSTALDNLEKMQAVQSCDDADLWESYDLLPSPQKFLIASRFSKDDIRWYFRSERKLMEIFNNSFKNPDKSKIRQAISKAVEDQKNIVTFQELYSVLNDTSKSDQQMVETYEKIAQVRGTLFIQIRQFLCNFYGKNPDNAFVDELIKRCPGSPVHKEMVRTMILKVEQGLDVWY